VCVYRVEYPHRVDQFPVDEPFSLIVYHHKYSQYYADYALKSLGREGLATMFLAPSKLFSFHPARCD
jgi:hypothetical protein